MPDTTVYSLWRGEEQLGTFTEQHLIHGDPDTIIGLAGVLRVSSPTIALEGMRQSHDFGELTQSPERVKRFGSNGEPIDAPPSMAVLSSTGAGPRSRQVPADQVLHIRDPQGKEVSTWAITLEQGVMPPNGIVTRMLRFRGLSEDRREAWIVSFVRESPLRNE